MFLLWGWGLSWMTLGSCSELQGSMLKDAWPWTWRAGQSRVAITLVTPALWGVKSSVKTREEPPGIRLKTRKVRVRCLWVWADVYLWLILTCNIWTWATWRQVLPCECRRPPGQSWRGWWNPQSSSSPRSLCSRLTPEVDNSCTTNKASLPLNTCADVIILDW